MVKKDNKTCIVCRKKYTFCTGCSDYDHLPRWMSIFCEQNCHDIYNATSMWGKVPVEETKALLDECDLSNKEAFHPVILNAINEVYGYMNTTTTVLEAPKRNETEPETEVEAEEKPAKQTIKISKRKKKNCEVI